MQLYDVEPEHYLVRYDGQGRAVMVTVSWMGRIDEKPTRIMYDVKDSHAPELFAEFNSQRSKRVGAD